MGFSFPFAYICDLLQKIQDTRRPSRLVIAEWFTEHRTLIDKTNDGIALLSTLLPDKRTDRVYGIQVKRLHNIVGRAFGLGVERKKELRRWTTPGAEVDLGDCVEAILTATVCQTRKLWSFLSGN
jgi:DNA ligase 4